MRDTYEGGNFFIWWLVIFVILLLLSFFVSPLFFLVTLLYVLLSIKVLNEYQRGVVFTLGRFDGIAGPGLVFIVPVVQYMVVVDMRIRTIDISPQEVITKDNVSVKVNGVVFYRVVDPAKAVLNVQKYEEATAALAQTVLRDVIGGVTLDELLENREAIASEIRRIVDEKTDKWGIDITEIRLQDIVLPENMKRALAVQAEAEREKRAVIIKSEGELSAAENYAKAAEIISKARGGITLRVLQTVADISKDPSQKFIILLPVELVEDLKTKKEG